MKAESLGQYKNVESVMTQKASIQNSTSLERVMEYYDDHFVPGFYEFDWYAELSRVQNIAKKQGTPLTPDNFRLITMANVEGAQLGYMSMEGQDRIKGMMSPFDPRRQLALTCHLATLNEKTHEYKEQMSDEFEKFSVEAAVGAWGVMLYTQNGEVTFPDKADIFDAVWLRNARKRGESNRKIIAPNRALNQGLRDLQFGITEAETMDDHEFEVTILPQLGTILGDYLDPGLAFYTSQHSPLRFYSFPSAI